MATIFHWHGLLSIRLRRAAGEDVSRTHLVGACDDAGKLALLLALALDHGLYDARMVRAQIDEAMGDASLPNGLEKGERCCVHGGRRRTEGSFTVWRGRNPAVGAMYCRSSSMDAVGRSEYTPECNPSTTAVVAEFGKKRLSSVPAGHGTLFIKGRRSKVGAAVWCRGGRAAAAVIGPVRHCRQL